MGSHLIRRQRSTGEQVDEDSPRAMFAAGPPLSGGYSILGHGTSMAPASLSAGSAVWKEQRARSVSIDYPESMTCSMSTLSSHPGSPTASIFSPRTPIFMAANDQAAALGPFQVLSHSRQTSLDSQMQLIVQEAKSPRSSLSSRRTLSLSLPIRLRQTQPTLPEHDEENEVQESRRRSTSPLKRLSSSSSRVTSPKIRHLSGRSFRYEFPV